MSGWGQTHMDTVMGGGVLPNAHHDNSEGNMC